MELERRVDSSWGYFRNLSKVVLVWSSTALIEEQIRCQHVPCGLLDVCRTDDSKQTLDREILAKDVETS